VGLRGLPGFTAGMKNLERQWFKDLNYEILMGKKGFR